eukprot:INCI18830.1.p1 GENE.INCI18830.1~~INCI18830.1.p1  ORF type:complete len:432 (-),score=68.46 INCI18830.1:1291-2586(-)
MQEDTERDPLQKSLTSRHSWSSGSRYRRSSGKSAGIEKLRHSQADSQLQSQHRDDRRHQPSSEWNNSSNCWQSASSTSVSSRTRGRSAGRTRGWVQAPPHKPKDVSHLISSDSDEDDSEAGASDPGISRHRANSAPIVVSKRYFLPRENQIANVAHLISSDSDDADDDSGNDTDGNHSGSNVRSSLEQSMGTTQEFLVGPPSHSGEAAASNAADAGADADSNAFTHTSNTELDYETMPEAHFGEAEEETAEDVPLPDGWYLYHDGDGFPYYYNDQTGESQWEAPESEDVATSAVAADTSNLPNAGEQDHHKLQAVSDPRSDRASSQSSAATDTAQLKEQVRALQTQLDSYRRGANRREGRDAAQDKSGTQDRHTRHQASQKQLLEWATQFPVVREALSRCEVCGCSLATFCLFSTKEFASWTREYSSLSCS